MRVSAIPAQITTVEDRIAGNLNLTQILLLAVPIFNSAVIFFILPPLGRLAVYKLVFIIFSLILCAGLAIRLNDRLVLDILKLRIRYESRPHVYVFRKQPSLVAKLKTYVPTRSKGRGVVANEISHDVRSTRVGHELMSDQQYSVTFHKRSGGLIVKISVAQ